MGHPETSATTKLGEIEHKKLCCMKQNTGAGIIPGNAVATPVQAI